MNIYLTHREAVLVLSSLATSICRMKDLYTKTPSKQHRRYLRRHIGQKKIIWLQLRKRIKCDQ